MATKMRGHEMNSLRHGHVLGGRATPTYRTWCSMRARCLNPNFHKYKSFGARGITICERWSKFENFLADMGERPEGKTLDRYPDKQGNYAPGNCRWATRSEQQRNRNDNHQVAYKGVTRLLIEWAELIGISAVTLRARLRV